MTDNRAALVKFGFDTGDYMCLCADCGLRFQGAKRSWRCRPCADEAVRGRAHTDDSANAPRAALVEKVARAFITSFGYDPDEFVPGKEEDGSDSWPRWAEAMYGAEVALSLALEEAARVAGPSPDDGGSDDYRRGREHAQAAIRALKEKSDE